MAKYSVIECIIRIIALLFIDAAAIVAFVFYLKNH